MIHPQAGRAEAGAFWRLLGMKLLRAEARTAVVTMAARSELLQLYGVVHGGAIASLIDGAIGAAVQTTLGADETTTTVDLQVMYDQAVADGLLRAEAALLKRGRRVVFGRCEVWNEAGELVAHGSATYLVRRAP